MRKNQSLGSVVLIVAFASLIGCGKKADESTQQPQPEPRTQPQPPKNPDPTPTPSKQPDAPVKPAPLTPPVFKLTADSFEKEFSADQKAAETKYVGKVGELSGTVELVTPIDAKQVRVSLKSARGGLPFCSFFVSDPKLVEKLGKGQTVRFHGTCQVDTAPYQVYFSPSEIVEKGPDTIVRLTAEQLAKEYGLDPDAFETKYRGTTLLVTGEVIAVRTGVADQTLMELKGDGKLKVECYRRDYQTWKWPANYKAGAQVRFLGSRTLARLEGAVRIDIDTPLDPE